MFRNTHDIFIKANSALRLMVIFMAIILLLGSITAMIFAVKRIMSSSDQKNCWHQLDKLKINGKAQQILINDNKLFIISDLLGNQHLTIIDPCHKSLTQQITIENLVE